MPSINCALLNKQIDELEKAIPNFEAQNPEISDSNIGWHIEHSLLVICNIIYALSKSEPKNYSWSFNFRRLVIFAKKKIPRGIVKAPKAVAPKEEYTSESLMEHIEKAKAKIAELSRMDKGLFFKHPFLGNLRLKKTITFLSIHTKHHLEIINEIREVRSEK